MTSTPSILTYNIHHTAIAVEDLDEAIERFGGRFGIGAVSRETVPEQGVEEAMIPVGGSFVQLLTPLDPETPVGRFLATHGEGLHHIAFAVADIDVALTHLAGEGARLIDASPRTGGGGARIAFVHPKDTAGTLIELVEVAVT